MAKLHRQGGFYVEYLQPTGPSRFQPCNSSREEAMTAVRNTPYAARVWLADGCAVEKQILAYNTHGEYFLETIVFLINPSLIYENINQEAFEV